MDKETPPVPRKALEKRLREISEGEYVSLRELEARILRRIAAKTR